MGRHAEFAVEKRMPIEKERFEPIFFVGPRETTGMRQLQADEQIIDPAELPLVLGHERFAQRGEIA